MLQVREERSGAGVLTLAIEGELDLATAPQVREPLEASIDGGTTRVVVDLRTCGFIDSTGLGILLRAAKRLEELDGGMALVSTDPQIRRLLELTMIDRTIPVFETREQALTGLDDGA
jgi:anti-sigma B factor antagonist